MHTNEHNGQRLARMRRRRDWTQQQLADATGYSLSLIKKVETGVRPLDRGQQILHFAEALACHPSEITGSPWPAPANDREASFAAGAVAAVHRALLVHDRPRISAAEADAVDLAGLAARVGQANRYRHSVTLARTAALLPDLLHDLQVAVQVLPAGPQRSRAYDLLCQGYECAMHFVYKLGHVAIATLATERVVWASLNSGDPLRPIAARWYEAGEYINIGEHDIAATIIDGALDELAAAGEDGPRALSLRGMLHLKAALNAARAADATQAEAEYARALHAAEHLGTDDRNDFDFMFGPTNAAIWGVAIPCEFGRGRDAVRRGEQIKLPASYAAERRTLLQIDLGRAHFMNGQREAALDAFLTAERISPQQTRLHPAVRETVGAMIRTAPRGRLAELGLRVGVL